MGGKENECGLCFVLEYLMKISNLSLTQLLGPIHSPAFLPFPFFPFPILMSKSQSNPPFLPFVITHIQNLLKNFLRREDKKKQYILTSNTKSHSHALTFYLPN